MKKIETILNNSSRLAADNAVCAIEEKLLLFKEALELTFHSGYPMAMRAARVVQLYCEKYPAALDGKIDEVVEKLIAAKIDGVKRCMLKVIGQCISLKKIEDIGPIVNQCFIWLNDPKEPVAVKVFCMDILEKACEMEPDLKYELQISLINQIEFGTTGFKNRATKLLKKIKK